MMRREGIRGWIVDQVDRGNLTTVLQELKLR
jgi:hypothetical protein